MANPQQQPQQPPKPGPAASAGKTRPAAATPARGMGLDAKDRGQMETILSQKKISGKWTLGRIMYLISALSDLDQGVEGKMKSSRNRAVWALFFLVILVLIAVSLSGKPAVIGLAVFVPLLFIVFNILKYRSYKNMDLTDEFRTYFGPLMRRLKDDLRRDDLISLTVDLAPLASEQYHKSKGKKYNKGNYYDCQDDVYERDLMSLSCRLEDKNTLQLRCWESLVKTSKKKRSGNKIKFRSSCKKKIDFDVRLYVNTDRYTCAPSAIDRLCAFKVITNEERGMVSIKYKERLASEDAMPDPHRTLKSIVSLYTFLVPKTGPAGEAETGGTNANMPV